MGNLVQPADLSKAAGPLQGKRQNPNQTRVSRLLAGFFSSSSVINSTYHGAQRCCCVSQGTHSSMTKTEAHSSLRSQSCPQDLVNKYLFAKWQLRAGFPGLSLPSCVRELAAGHTVTGTAEHTVSRRAVWCTC